MHSIAKGGDLVRDGLAKTTCEGQQEEFDLASEDFMQNIKAKEPADMESRGVSNKEKRPSHVLKQKVDGLSQAFKSMNPELANQVLNALAGLTNDELKSLGQKKVLPQVTEKVLNLNPTPEPVGDTKDAEADKPMPEKVDDTEDEEADEPTPEPVCDTVDHDDGSVSQSSTSPARPSAKRVRTDSSEESHDAGTGASQQAESKIGANKKRRSTTRKTQPLERLCEEQQKTTDILRSTAKAQQKQIDHLIKLMRRCAESLESFQ